MTIKFYIYFQNTVYIMEYTIYIIILRASANHELGFGYNQLWSWYESLLQQISPSDNALLIWPGKSGRTNWKAGLLEHWHISQSQPFL